MCFYLKLDFNGNPTLEDLLSKLLVLSQVYKFREKKNIINVLTMDLNSTYFIAIWDIYIWFLDHFFRYSVFLTRFFINFEHKTNFEGKPSKGTGGNQNLISNIHIAFRNM